VRPAAAMFCDVAYRIHAGLWYDEEDTFYHDPDQEPMQRPTFRSSIALDFFSVKALQVQIGHPLSVWPLALLKELIDNALDSCELQGVPPDIAVTVEIDTLSVRDNGGGLPEPVLRDSLDYTVRVSDKTFFISPTRGQLGNGFKTLWAAPAVAAGDTGAVEVVADGQRHTIRVRMDRLTQTPHVERTTVPDATCIVKSGTTLRLIWPRIASLLAFQTERFYTIHTNRELIQQFAVFNPHASFAATFDGEYLHIAATHPDWRKWTPADEKTSREAREAEQAPRPTRRRHVLRQSPRYKRRGARQVLAGLSVADGQVLGQCAGRKRFVDFQAFVQQVVVPEAQRRGVQTIVLIVDNGTTHAPKQLERSLQEQAVRQRWGLTVQVYWLPTNASWLDQIEIWFSVLQRKLLQPNHFTSTDDLDQAIMNFIAYGNQVAKPIRWSYTIDKLERKLGMN